VGVPDCLAKIMVQIWVPSTWAQFKTARVPFYIEEKIILSNTFIQNIVLKFMSKVDGWDGIIIFKL